MFRAKIRISRHHLQHAKRHKVTCEPFCGRFRIQFDNIATLMEPLDDDELPDDIHVGEVLC